MPGGAANGCKVLTCLVVHRPPGGFIQTRYRHVAAAAALTLSASFAHADRGALPNWTLLKNALVAAVAAESGGLDLQMWATLVDRDGVVCEVAFSGQDRGSQWPS